MSERGFVIRDGQDHHQVERDHAQPYDDTRCVAACTGQPPHYPIPFSSFVPVTGVTPPNPIDDMIRLAAQAFDRSIFGDTPYDPVSPITARKIGAYMTISDELARPERYPYVAPVLSRRQRLRAWRQDRAWSIRHRLATKLLGYDPEDERYV